VLTAVLVWVCLRLHEGLQRLGATWLFALPGRRGKSVPDGAVPRQRLSAGR
jgi:hypothetical protein